MDKRKNCPCECPKPRKPRRKAAPKPTANKRFTGFMGPRGEPVMSPISTNETKLVNMLMPKKESATISTQTGEKELVKPMKYQRKETPSTAKEIMKTVVEPLGRIRIPSSIANSNETYNPVLGTNIPIKREGMFIKKDTGLFEPETRGASTVEERRIKDMMGQTSLDSFFKKK